MKHILDFTLISASLYIAVMAPAAAQQVEDEISVDLTVTALPDIEITTPAGDIALESDGSEITSGFSARSVRICFSTNLSEIRTTVTRQNPALTGNAALISPDVQNDHINYSLLGGLEGEILLGGLFDFVETPVDTWDLSQGDQGGACGATDYSFLISVGVETDPGKNTRAIREVILDNGLADGVPRVFSDIVTVTFEPTLVTDAT